MNMPTTLISGIFISLTASSLVVTSCSSRTPSSGESSEDSETLVVSADGDTYRVFAMEYGRSKRFRRSTLIRSADREARQDLSWQAWLVAGKGRFVLVDTGFREKSVGKGYRFQRFEPITEPLRRVGVKAQQIDDVIITHVHWDHAGNTSPFTNANFWIQEESLRWSQKLVSKSPRKAGVRREDIEALGALEREKRLTLVNGDREIIDGISVFAGGRHTPGVQWVSVRTGVETIVLATDIAYVYENIETETPPGGTYDPARDLEQIRRMLKTASRPELIIPGHDPLVLTRNPRRGKNIVEIGGRR